MGVDHSFGNSARCRERQCSIKQAFLSHEDQRFGEINGEWLHATAKTGSK